MNSLKTQLNPKTGWRPSTVSTVLIKGGAPVKSLFTLAVLSFVMLGTAPSSYADTFTFTTSLSGPAESPPVPSPGVGSAVVTYDDALHLLRVQVTFSGLVAVTTASHIHSATAVPGAGNAGVATQVPSFAGFPLGVTSGSMDNTFDLTLASSWNPAFIAANGGTPGTAEAALFMGMIEGRAYLNIHTSEFPGGEIRGFLEPVPEPATLLLLGSGLVGIVARLRRSRKTERSNA
jgi:hypothetical protein